MRSVLTLLILFQSCVLVAQKSERVFIYGTLHGSNNSITGYFWFNNVLTQMGQHIIYKESLDTKKKKTLYAKDFTTFENDSIFLRTFKTVLYGTGRLDAMLARIVPGELELYNAIYRGFYSFSKTDHFYLYDGKESIRLVKRKFKEQMKELLGDDTYIIQKIETEELTYSDLPEIIHNYNLRRKRN